MIRHNSFFVACVIQKAIMLYLISADRPQRFRQLTIFTKAVVSVACMWLLSYTGLASIKWLCSQTPWYDCRCRELSVTCYLLVCVLMCSRTFLYVFLYKSGCFTCAHQIIILSTVLLCVAAALWLNLFLSWSWDPSLSRLAVRYNWWQGLDFNMATQHRSLKEFTAIALRFHGTVE